jgi:hypothetical protein
MTRKTTAPAARFDTREAWLIAAVDGLRPLFAELGEEVPAVRVSVGFTGGRGNRAATIGQCWATAASADKVAQVFVSPVLADPIAVLAVLVHELVHAVDDCQSGHKGRFGKIARALGLEGKLTATTAGDELIAKLRETSSDLGEYPHAALGAGDGAEGPKKQGTRMLKVECAEGSGYVVRMTRKWLDEFGAPTCPCHSEQMVEAEA